MPISYSEAVAMGSLEVASLPDSPITKLLLLKYPEQQRVTKTGHTMAKTDARSIPVVGTSSPLAGRFILIMIDPDAPAPSIPFLSPIIHWIQTDLISDPNSSSDGTFWPLTSTVPPASEYLPPGAPPISAPHRYMCLLYEQPKTFSAKALKELVPTRKIGRMRFDMAGFEKALGLGQVIAVHYFLCGASSVSNM